MPCWVLCRLHYIQVLRFIISHSSLAAFSRICWCKGVVSNRFVLKYISGQCIGGCEVFGPPLSMSETAEKKALKPHTANYKAKFETLAEIPFDQVLREFSVFNRFPSKADHRKAPRWYNLASTHSGSLSGTILPRRRARFRSLYPYNSCVLVLQRELEFEHGASRGVAV